MGIVKDSERAIELGKASFAAGKSRHCYGDPAWLDLVKTYVEGKPDHDRKAHRARMRLGMAWYRGWDRANLAAPVEGV